jgi:hypothetical protein
MERAHASTKSPRELAHAPLVKNMPNRNRR